METDFSFLSDKESDYFFKPANYQASPKSRGLDLSVVEAISKENNDPKWLRELRFEAFESWQKLKLPVEWAPERLRELNFEELNYFPFLENSNSNEQQTVWENLSDSVRETFEALGVREEDETFLGGLKAQFDGSVVYTRLAQDLEKKGVVFVDSVTGLRDFPELFREAFGSVVPFDSNKLAALNTAVFSGGGFLYIPDGVKVGVPLKTYFRMNQAGCGQFGRTLIILGEGSELIFMEGCSAADHSADGLHASVGEIIAHKDSKLQYITFQNWSRSIFNLVQMRAIAHEGAHVKWLDCNVGGKLTMKYPTTVLQGKNARSEIISIGYASTGQHHDTGGKMIHLESDTSSSIVSRSISVGEGRASYRGFVDIDRNASHCKNNTECDALLLNTESRTDTFPAISVSGNANAVQHEASVSRISEEQIFYMQQRGLSEAEAISLSVNGFVNDLVKEFPIEYSAPLKHLIDVEMEGSVG